MDLINYNFQIEKHFIYTERSRYTGYVRGNGEMMSVVVVTLNACFILNCKLFYFFVGSFIFIFKWKFVRFVFMYIVWKGFLLFVLSSSLYNEKFVIH